MPQDLIQVTYDMIPPSGQTILQACRDLALEQTVEVPEDCLTSQDIREKIPAQILATTSIPGEAGRYRCVLGYPVEITAFELPQFLNILFGNISLKPNIRIVDLELPPYFLSRFRGPNHGIAGLRRLTGVYGRPLAATALKPLGSSPETLAQIAQAFALGGIDLIKDDHGLTDQPFCPFVERVRRCQAAIAEANQKTGRQALYFPNITGPFEKMAERIELAIREGVRGVLLSPWLTGLDALRYFSGKYSSLAFMTHPAFTGAYFQAAGHGIAPHLFLGTLFRLAGADISVYPNAGGRFPLTPEECRQIGKSLTGPLGDLKPAFPGPAGGMQLDQVERMAEEYGPDAVYIIGGALLKPGTDLRHNAEVFTAAIQKQFPAATFHLKEEAGVGSAADSPDLPLRHASQENFTWEGVKILPYKEEGSFFKAISRQILFTGQPELPCQWRYFEIAPGGYSTLERHAHVHVVMVLRGRGQALLGKEVVALKPHDVIQIPAKQWHQFRATSGEAFGFLCLVHTERDRPERPTPSQLESLQADAHIAAFIKI